MSTEPPRFENKVEPIQKAPEGSGGLGKGSSKTVAIIIVISVVVVVAVVALVLGLVLSDKGTHGTSNAQDKLDSTNRPTYQSEMSPQPSTSDLQTLVQITDEEDTGYASTSSPANDITETTTVTEGMPTSYYTNVSGSANGSQGTTEQGQVYTDCTEVPASGVYRIQPMELTSSILVYCDMNSNGGGWIVVLRRKDGSTNFNLLMQSYIDGFGDLTGEFWLGLSVLRDLTCGNDASEWNVNDHANGECFWELRVDVGDWRNNIANENYEYIFIYGDAYRLEVGTYSGTAGNEFINQLNAAFSANDNDKDSHLLLNLAQVARGGWWYNLDTSPNLCGYYCEPTSLGCSNSMNWGWLSSLKTASMKIRRVVPT
ncbi:fibrinogen-like protein 1 [Amphiura filiformis]|uniref:fibrinogen-like protein 1 n=1 Tax=Amphiura filiformis TaxID=82378 RepID=UPI003B21532A